MIEKVERKEVKIRKVGGKGRRKIEKGEETEGKGERDKREEAIRF